MATWNINETETLYKGHYSHGSPYSFAVGPLIAKNSMPAGATIYLASDDPDAEWETDVMVGEDFEVGDQTWHLESVDAGGERHSATIKRVS